MALPALAPLADDALLSAALQRARRLGRAVLASVPAPAADADLLALVARARAAGDDALLWEQPAGQTAIAGIGTAWSAAAAGPDRFVRLAAASAALAADAPCANPLFLCGAAFAPQVAAGGLWRGLPAARVVVPTLQLVRRGATRQAAVNLLVAPDADLASLARTLTRHLAALAAERPSTGSGRTDAHAEAGADTVRAAPVEARSGDGEPTRYEVTAVPPPAVWRAAVGAVLQDIDAGRFTKLVLARACRLRATREFDCAAAVAHLRRTYAACTTFWIAAGGADFLGATPETLLRLDGHQVHSGAVAGSIARGTSPAADRALAAALLASAKDRREHAVVVDAIAAALRPLCASLDVAAAPRVLPLANVQHLHTTISGRLRADAHALDLVGRLHPTPAVGGFPRAAALAALAAREPTERGWYAGPIGWFDAQGRGEFCVAIRSALVRGREATLFAGAGIVAGSDPAAELAETRLKLQPLLGALLEL